MLNQETIKNCRNYPKGPSEHVDGKARRKYLKLKTQFDKAKGSMKAEMGPCLRGKKGLYIRWDCCPAHRKLGFILFQMHHWASLTHYSEDYGVCSDGWCARVGVPLSKWADEYEPFPWGEYPPLPVKF